MSQHHIRVMVLSNRDIYDGLLFQGTLDVDVRDEPGESLAMACLRELRKRGVNLQDGDALFFPDAAGKHRLAEIQGEGASCPLHGWHLAGEQEDDDSADAECSRMEADMLMIHDTLTDAGLDGSINADSIVERIKRLVRTREATLGGEK